MRFLKNSLILAIISLVVFSSCKNDLKLSAPYKEIPMVHAVLNPFDKLQMIRINKVFLGEGDANVMAKVADSNNYQQGDLTVTVTRFLNGKQINASPLNPDPAKRLTMEFKDSVIYTKEGAFNNMQRVYVCYDSILEGLTPPNGSAPGTYTVYGDYVLTIKNNKTGNVFTAKSTAINQVRPNQGHPPLAYPYRPYPSGVTVGFINYAAANPTMSVGSAVLFRPVDGAKVHEVIIRTNFYSEPDFVYDYADYVFNDPKGIRNLSGTPYINISFRSGDYFGNLENELAKKKVSTNVLRRHITGIDFIIYSSTQEYLDFMEYSKPSLSINQNKPLYSNFDNKAAYGIFAFRSTVIVRKELEKTFIDAISSNSALCKYKFVNQFGQPCN